MSLCLNSSPGLTHETPPPEAELSEFPPEGPPRFQAEGERETENFPLSHLVPFIFHKSLRSDLTQKSQRKVYSTTSTSTSTTNNRLLRLKPLSLCSCTTVWRKSTNKQKRRGQFQLKR